MCGSSCQTQRWAPVPGCSLSVLPAPWDIPDPVWYPPDTGELAPVTSPLPPAHLQPWLLAACLTAPLGLPGSSSPVFFRFPWLRVLLVNVREAGQTPDSAVLLPMFCPIRKTRIDFIEVRRSWFARRWFQGN